MAISIRELVQQAGRLHQLRWRRAVYFPPLDFMGGWRWAPYWERLGAKLFLGAAAFLALAARKRPA